MWNLTFIFSGSHKKFSLVLLQITNYIYSPWKMKKKNAILFLKFWYKVFVPWKMKLLNFRMESVLKWLGGALNTWWVLKLRSNDEKGKSLILKQANYNVYTTNAGIRPTTPANISALASPLRLNNNNNNNNNNNSNNWKAFSFK